MYKIALTAKENQADVINAVGRTLLDAVADLLSQIARERDATDEFECTAELLEVCSRLSGELQDRDSDCASAEADYDDMGPAYSFTLAIERV